MSGQIPKTIEAEPVHSHTPEGHPARYGKGRPTFSAVVIITPRFVRWPQPDRTKKIEYSTRPTRMIAPTPALTYVTTRYRRHRSGTPFSSCSPASSNERPLPAT